MSALSELLKGNRHGWGPRQTSREAEKRGIHLPQGTAANYFSGRHGVPSPAVIEAFSEVLDIPASAIREAVGLPAQQAEPYAPPAEAHRLTLRQRQAFDELIRSVVVARSPAVDHTVFLAKLAHFDTGGEGWGHIMYRARLAYNSNDADGLRALVAEIEGTELDEGWPVPNWDGRGPAELSDDELRTAASESREWEAYLRTKRPDLFSGSDSDPGRIAEDSRLRWRGKAPGEMTDDELREAAGGDEVWADYIRTKRPDLADWDF